MFTLIDQKAKLSNFNSRAELHGEERAPAGDLQFEVNVSADMLAHFSDTLRWSLFHKGDPAEQDLADQSHHAPKLRYPELGVLKWDKEFLGYTLTIAHGIGGKSDLILSECEVNKFTLAPQEGEQVLIGFRVQAHPSEKQAGALCFLIQETVEISLEPPEAAA